MSNETLRSVFKATLNTIVLSVCLAVLPGFVGHGGFAAAAGESAPAPLLSQGKPVDWWFAFKFNTKSFLGCGGAIPEQRQCLFGGEVQNYAFSQQFVYASSENQTLEKGVGCVGGTTTDPVGATFEQIYNGSYYFVIWNDQFYDDPSIAGCSTSCSSPWGHSKGMLAWNEAGEGFVLQVTTPSWPAAGSKLFPRKTDGNTLGCVKDDDVKVSQHFFSLKLSKSDLVNVLIALKNASVVTDPGNRQVVNNGGPKDVQALVNSLGKKSKSKSITKVQLSSGVGLISKPSALHVLYRRGNWCRPSWAVFLCGPPLGGRTRKSIRPRRPQRSNAGTTAWTSPVRSPSPHLENGTARSLASRAARVLISTTPRSAYRPPVRITLQFSGT